MPEFMKRAAGTFCWAECNANDSMAARQFYTNVFGWQMSEMAEKMSDGSTYATANISGKNVGGIMQLPASAKKMGGAPHWLAYIAVDNCDQVTQKCATLKGNVVVQPVDMGPGRMSVIADPTGAMVAMWQSVKSMGPYLYDEPNAMCWNELMTSNIDVAGGFYAKLFDWKPESMDMGGTPYTVFKTGDTMIAGMFGTPPEMKGTPSNWSTCFRVNNCDDTCKMIAKHGGKVMSEPMDVPTVGRYAVCADPQGAMFTLLQPPK